MPAKIGCTGPKKKAYNATYKKLQALQQQQQELLEQTRQQVQDTKNLHLLLADGICQQRVLFELFLPLHKQWMDEGACQPSVVQRIMQQSHGLDILIPIVTGCNPMIRTLLEATPAQVQQVHSMSIEEASQMHRDIVGQLVLLLEMLSPQRYQQPAAAQQKQQQTSHTATGPNQAAAAAAAAAAADEAVNSQEAYKANRRRLAELIDQIRLTVGLLTLHRPLLVFEMATLNYETMQRSVPPMHHAEQASRRLQLSSWQLQQLRLMLRRYNRASQAQQKRGITLLGLSENSSNLQTVASQAVKQQSAPPPAPLLGFSLLHRPSAIPVARSPPAMEPATAIAAVAAAVTATTAAAESRDSARGMDTGSSSSSGGGGGSGSGSGTSMSGEGAVFSSKLKSSSSTQQQEEFGEDAEDDLEQQLQKHLHSRMELSQLMGFWVLNTLTDLQIAQFIVYTWPWYPMCPVLAASSVLMLPMDDAPPSGNGVAADAERLAIQQQMWQRGAGMGRQLDWVLRFCTGHNTA